MKKLFSTFMLILTVIVNYAQTVAPANIYPSNLEENMYYEKYDDNTKTIYNMFFMVLTDGDNSEMVTPAFKTKLYLLPEGSSNKEDLIIIKTFDDPGIYHMGSREYKDINVELGNIPGLQTGNYRIGIWVDSEDDVEEDASDNATLFRGTIKYTATGTPAQQEEKMDDGWGW